MRKTCHGLSNYPRRGGQTSRPRPGAKALLVWCGSARTP